MAFTPFSASVRDSLADVVGELGGTREAQMIREGADIMLTDLAERLDVSLRELADAWSIEAHRQHGLYIGFHPDGTIMTFKRRSELQ